MPLWAVTFLVDELDSVLKIYNVFSSICEAERGREREISSIHWFLPQMAGPGRNLEPRTPLSSPMWVEEVQALVTLSAVSQDALAGWNALGMGVPGSEIEEPGCKLAC